MARNKKSLPLLENIKIEDVASEGKAIARVNDVVVFVPHVVPGDVVDLQVTKKKSSFMEANAVSIKEYSSIRSLPFCEHYGVCGGCKWQLLPYEEQLKYKQRQVTDNLTRIGKIQLPAPPNLSSGEALKAEQFFMTASSFASSSPPEGELEGAFGGFFFPILGSAKTTFYRNKLEFTFSNKRWLIKPPLTPPKGENSSPPSGELEGAVGFHISGFFDKVLDINKCWLQDDISNQLRNFIRRYALDNDLSFFDIRKQEGFLRNMIVRTSTTGELMLIVVFYHEDEQARIGLLNAVNENFPQITSLIYIINGKANDTITDQTPIVFKGRDHIFEQMEGLRFKIGAKSFYQTNSEQAYELYKITRNFAGLTGNELVYDLYTGTGTIANFVAKQARQVIGIEYVTEAIENAKINSEINGISNTLFFAGDMKNILTHEFVLRHGNPDVIITDPPRAGMHADVVETILKASPEKIVYVSCNPATQARDLALLDEAYRVTAVQPVDMFPHTHHVENVVLLEKRF